MSAYLGKLGQLIPIYSNPSMGVSGIPARSFQTTLEGRVKAQVKPVGRRVWELSAAYASPGELAALMGFVNGEWGNGPFVWVPPTAPAINLLAPGVASCGADAVMVPAVTVVGPLLCGDDWAGRSLANSAPASPMPFGPATIPIIPGKPVTGSAWVVGVGAKVRLDWKNAAGGTISSVASTGSGIAGTATRLSVTGTPPVGAVSCSLYGTATTQAARPAVTWTDHANEWGSGEGCAKAIVEAVDRTALTGSDLLSGRRDSNLSFTIREVG